LILQRINIIRLVFNLLYGMGDCLLFGSKKNIIALFTILLLFFWGSPVKLHGQNRDYFTGEQNNFIKELENFMGHNLSDKEEEVLESFTAAWRSEQFTTGEKEIILNSANLFAIQNARPAPHFINLLKLLDLFANHDAARNHFPVWLEAFLYYLEEGGLRLSVINESLERVHELLNDNILFGSAAVTWKASGSGYRFHFDEALLISFSETDLLCFSGNDSIVIRETEGILNIMEKKWEGSNGTVGWERSGHDRDEVKATLGEYKIDLVNPHYSADSVKFAFGRHFQGNLYGTLEDRVTRGLDEDKVTYPRFRSYREDLTINNIFPKIHYNGGISMRGGSFTGSGSESSGATLKFIRKEDTFFVARSEHFVLSVEEINSNSSSIVFYIENDSIYHPDLKLAFSSVSGDLTLTRNDNVMSGSFYTNTYHRVNMDFGRLIWNVNEDKIVFTMPRGSSRGSAEFESLNYFSKAHFHNIHGMEKTHPLFSIRRFASSNEDEELSVEKFASFLKKPLSGVRHLLIDLALEGFIYYDTSGDVFVIRDKLNDYIRANNNMIDHDIIVFESETDAPRENASLYLNTNELKINGIKGVNISNVHNVNLFPENDTIVLKRNRNFRFNGVINAGYLTFFGNNFQFDYEEFSIGMQKIDSIKILAASDEYDMYGRALVNNVKNIIRSTTGMVYIDKPDNKSGREEHKDYPKFQSSENSYVHYDNPGIYGGIYESDKVYFELFPFQVDSLSTFRFEFVELEGKFVSGGIFPEIEESLTLQKDMSLGFTHKTTEKGLPLYGERGTFYDTITMSNSGLKGGGKVEYLTSGIHSPGFSFYPDSMNATASKFEMEKLRGKEEYPFVASKNNPLQWLPEKDSLLIMQGEEPFRVFNENTLFRGNLVLSREELSGEGMLDAENARLTSSLFTFGSTTFESDTTDFILFGGENDTLFISSNVKTSVDIEEQHGNFTLNSDNEIVKFPGIFYNAYPAAYSWDIEKMNIELRAEKIFAPGEYAGAKYISYRQGQDSLSYISPLSTYDYSNNLLTSEEVKYVRIADALIHPTGEEVKVKENAEMQPLEDARIEAGEHTIHKAKLKIEGKNSYFGYGYYDYIDDKGSTQTIRMDTISVSDSLITTAHGKLAENDNFRLNDHFGFKGEVTLRADNPRLKFSGGVMAYLNCGPDDPRWLSFEYEVNPQNVMLPVEKQPNSVNGKRLYSGLYVAGDPSRLESAFMGEWNDNALPVINAGGYLQYHSSTGEYRVGLRERFSDPSHPGNYLSIDREECILYGEGKIDPGADLGQLKLNAAGSFTSLTEEGKTSLDLMMGADFFFSEEAIEAMAEKLLKGGESEPPDSGGFFFNRGLNELLGKEAAGEYRSKSDGALSRRGVPPEMDKTMFFSRISLLWNKETQSYRSSGKLNLKYIGGEKINRQVNGFIEISKSGATDFMDIYIEADEDNWYYFGYTRGVMQAYSSDPSFVEIIDDLRTRRREMRVPRGETPYIYMLATETKLNQFFSRYNNNAEAGE